MGPARRGGVSERSRGQIQRLRNLFGGRLNRAAVGSLHFGRDDKKTVQAAVGSLHFGRDDKKRSRLPWDPSTSVGINEKMVLGTRILYFDIVANRTTQA